MSRPLILEGRILPNEDVKFAVQVTVGEVTMQSRVLEFKAPPAAELINRLEEYFTYKIIKKAGEKEPFSKQWKLDRYQKIVINDGGEKKPGIRVRIDESTDNYTGLKKGKKIIFRTSSSGNLSDLNGKEREIISIETQKSNKRKWIKVKIRKSEWNAMPGSEWSDDNPQDDEGRELTVPNNNIIEIETRDVNSTQIELQMDPEINTKLINKDTIRDVVVFAFSQFDGPFNSKVKRFYLQKQDGKDLVSREDQVEKNSLGYAKAKALFFNSKDEQKLKYTNLRFDPDNGKKIIFYAAIVRYLKTSKGNWVRVEQDGAEELDNENTPPKGWLQLNQEDRPIWLRAVEGG